MTRYQPAVLAISAYSGTGKTTLLQQIIPLLKQHNINVAAIKHSHHDIDIDIPGKDSYALRKAGANQTIVACDQRWALVTETPNTTLNLHELIKQFDPDNTDLILVEGFKNEPLPKIMLFREEVGKPFAGLIDSDTIALASDKSYTVSVPLLDINNIKSIVEFIINWLNNLK